jgi:intracellular septation protein A
MRPISVFADVVPFFGNVAGVGIVLVAAISASAISMVVVAVAWIFYRPLLGILLLMGALAAAVFGIVLLVRKTRERKAAAAPVLQVA